MPDHVSFPRQLTAETLGTALLLAIVVGSGIMAERLAGGNVAIALLANALATGAGLVALILTFGPISGCHINPVVSVVMASRGALPWRRVPGYVLAQGLGAVLGTWLAHLMFDLDVLQVSTHVRHGPGQWLSEALATFGLIGVICGSSRTTPLLTPFAVAAYITAAYWFTASTSFANPAVTLARSLTETFAGIRPVDAWVFIGMQILGAAAATGLFAWLCPPPREAQHSPKPDRP
jgi:glycerol uptake facilitator-like aquaporin